MKKYIFFIICIFSIFSNTNAFFGWGNELDLYKNIDEWIEELEDKMIIYEANWWLKETWILKEINELAKTKNEKACLDESKQISSDDFNSISNKWEVSKLSNYISDECKKDGNLSNKSLELYSDYFNQHYKRSKDTADRKSNKIYNISKIWLFSDWIVENSWFDLITDIEEIDKIIFSSKTDYIGEDNVDLTDSVNWLLSSVRDNWNDIMSYSEWTDQYPNKYKPSLYNITNSNIQNDNISETEVLYSCPVNNSWLSDSNVSLIFTDINKIKLNKAKDSIIYNEKLEFHEAPSYVADKSSLYNETNSSWNWWWSAKSWWYSKVRDNWVWPCQSFFCINIDFIMYQHNVFWWNNEMTIEYLLNRSNEHLSKFASTSLIPAKMSTNLFEIGLKDLNLPDIFHMAMQVSTKPVPILRLEKQDKQEESEFASKNLLEKYYDLHWLNYKRRNDIVLVKKLEQEKQSILATQQLNNSNASKKMDEYNEYLDKQNDKIRVVQKAIEKRVSNWVLDTFEEQYVELDKFTFSIYNYVQDLHTIITKMKEIPIDKW